MHELIIALKGFGFHRILNLISLENHLILAPKIIQVMQMLLLLRLN